MIPLYARLRARSAEIPRIVRGNFAAVSVLMALGRQPRMIEVPS